MKKLLIISVFLKTHFCFSQVAPTIGEVFDFNVGDEFHFERMVLQLAGSGIDRMYITEKRFSKNLDTVFYKGTINSYSNYFNPAGNPPQGAWYDFNESYTNLDSSIYYYIYNNLPFDMLDIMKEITFDSLCARPTFEIFEGLFFTLNHTYRFGKGLGIIENSEIWGGKNEGVRYTQFYYKKGDDECGIPNYISKIDEYSEATNIEIYPNPTDQFIQLEIPNSTVNTTGIKILNIEGTLIEEFANYVSNTQIDVSALSPGIYFIHIKLGKFVTSKSFFKQ